MVVHILGSGIFIADHKTGTAVNFAVHNVGSCGVALGFECPLFGEGFNFIELN